MSTLAQQCAAHALGKVKNLEPKGVPHYGHYVSYVSSLPARILTSGLGQAMAQLLAQAKGNQTPHRMLYDHVQDWLCSKRSIFGNETDLIRGIVNGDQDTYVRAQAEALAYLNWLKKFARAYLRRPDSMDQEG